MTAREKNIARVKALLEKNVENGATEAEAISALTKATQLMRDYYISEHELKDPYLGEKCVLKEVPLIKSGYDLGLFYAELAELFDCEYFYSSRRIAFFGFEEDTELCAYFYKLIIETCLREKDAYMRSSEGRFAKQFSHGRTVASSFVKGFLLRVGCKMRDLYKDKVSNLPQQTGLMVLDKSKKVGSQFEKLGLKIRNADKNVNIGDSIAYRAGVDKGEDFQIMQGIKDHNQSNVLQLS